jgi:hypothetical protein
MSAPESGQETPKEGGATQPVKRKFMNGWTRELEDLMADWADKAACYRWMHEKTSTLCQEKDNYFNYPIIILSGLTASANFALNSIVGDDKEMQKWAQIGLGGASLLTGILQTFMNKLGYAKNTEAHRVAGISWGKFNRQLCIEMNLHPDERMDSTNFLKMFRIELDRLIEQSPSIPELIIKQFNELFKNTPDVVKPEITGILQHTKVYKDTNSRLKRIAAEATVNLHYKRGVIKQLVSDDLEKKTRKFAIEETRKMVTEMFEQQKALNASVAAAAAAGRKRGDQPPSVAFAEKLKEERASELKEVAQTRAGAVAELRGRFKSDSSSSRVSARNVTFAKPGAVAWAETIPSEKEAVSAPLPTQPSEVPDVPAIEPQPQTIESLPLPNAASAASNAENTTIDTVITISEVGFHTPHVVEEDNPATNAAETT